VIITYTDEDDDIITISSNEELEDAFLQFVNKDPPVVRARALTKSTAATTDEAYNMEKSYPKQRKWKGNEIPRPLRKMKNRLNALQAEMLEKDRLHMAMKEKLNAVGMDKTEMNSYDFSSDTAKMEPMEPSKEFWETTGAPQVDIKATRVQPDTIPKPLVTEVVCPKPSKVEIQETQPEDFHLGRVKKDFIHGRHTCDGCFTSPIIGYRFNAINLPDYDLCFKCVKNYKGTDVHFQPEELDRDQYLQKRWQARKLKQERQSDFKQRAENKRSVSSKSKSSKPCVFKQIAVEFCDAALNEAIKRSLNFEQMIDTKVKSGPLSVPVVNTDTHEEKVVIEPVEEATDPEEVEVPTTVQVKDVASQVSTDDKEQVFEEVEVDDVVDVTPQASSKEQFITKEEAECVSEPDLHLPVAPTHNPQVLTHQPIDGPQLQIGTPEMDESSGAKILEGEEEDDADANSNASSSSDEWQVVDEDGQVTDHMVAQAAQMLGSALFQSDMASEDMDIGSGESFTSGLTSVPSLKSKTEIASVLLTRWEKELLSQLHEFGFLDDNANVEAFGFLEAANMGVYCDDPITINAVVDYLLKQRKVEEHEA
jgi:hypothetical protein